MQNSAQRQQQQPLQQHVSVVETVETTNYGQTKSTAVAYLLWFFFGYLGLHRFYLRRPLTGVVWLLTLGICGVGWIVDVFLVPGMVAACNTPSTTTTTTTYVQPGQPQPVPIVHAAPGTTTTTTTTAAFAGQPQPVRVPHPTITKTTTTTYAAHPQPQPGVAGQPVVVVQAQPAGATVVTGVYGT